jgi:hypothetical protein
VDVVNVVVVSALAQGKASELRGVLKNAGSGLYLGVAESIAQPFDKFELEDAKELRTRLERDAQRALSLANRSLGRFAALDGLAIVAIVASGVWAMTVERPSLSTTLGLLAATVLWFANVRGARAISTRAYAGAMALVDSLVKSAEDIREHLGATEREA